MFKFLAALRLGDLTMLPSKKQRKLDKATMKKPATVSFFNFLRGRFKYLYTILISSKYHESCKKKSA